jgi:plasmid stabilization system protein ParE
VGWQVSITPEAREDLEDLTSFVSDYSTLTAERVGLELLAIIASLDEFPYRGGSLLSRPDLRKLIHHHVQIIYAINESEREVGILRLWDARQDPSALKL